MHEEWPTLDEVVERTKISKRTIQRKVEQGAIKKAFRNVPGRKPLPVLDPQDVEKLTQQTLKPLPAPKPKEPRHSELAHALVTLASTLPAAIAPTAPPRHDANGATVPIERKVFLTLKEAVAFSGLTEAHLLRLLKGRKLKHVMTGGYRIRRADLERL